MLRSGRKRQQELAEREAAGENLWTKSFSEGTRVKIKLAAADTIGIHAADDVYGFAHGLLCRQWGQEKFITASVNSTTDLIGALQIGDDDLVADVIEAVYSAILFTLQNFSSGRARPVAGPKAFAERVNDILREERVAFELVEGQMVDLESEELHVAVVAPALRLLSGREGFDKVEIAYRNAIMELSGGSADDAITDAGTALQEMLTALGCNGSSLGPLIGDARRRGLVAPHDARFDQAISNVMDWVSADRSQSGEAHHVSNATPEDAWLIVHVVGALILRLASGPPRAPGA